MILSTLRTQIKWILAVFLVVFVLSIGLTYDFGGGSSDSDGSRGDYAVARIDGRELRLSHLYAELRNYLENTGVRDLKEEDLPGVYQIILNNIVTSKAVNDEVRRLKISASDEEVEARLKVEEARYITRENFQRTLQLQGVTLDQVRASIAQELAVSKLLDSATAAVTVSDEEVRSFYDAVKDLPFLGLSHAAGIHADVARLRTAQAGEALVQALKDGASWDDAVKALPQEDLISSTPADNPAHFSESEMTGVYGFIGELTDGEVAGPQEMASDNFMVVRRVKAVEASVTPFEEVQELLRQELLAERRQEETNKYLASLVNNVRVEILAPDLFPQESEAQAEAPQPAAEAGAEEGSEAETQEAPAETEVPQSEGEGASEAETVAPQEVPAQAEAEAEAGTADQEPQEESSQN